MWKRVQLNSNELLFARHANIWTDEKARIEKDDESEEARY